MRSIIRYLLVGVCALLVSSAKAQPINVQNRVEKWNDMWMNFTNNGYFGNIGPRNSSAMHDPCPSDGWGPQCELPGGSGQEYMFQAALWIGAVIDSNGFLTPRVSTSTDGWLGTPIREFWPGRVGQPGSDIVEISRLDTVNCFGDNIHSLTALTDHEFTSVFTDTLRDVQYVRNDPASGPHRPLGIEITQTTYAMMGDACNHILWLQYDVENIGDYTLRDIYLGLYVDGDVGPLESTDEHTDDLTGFEPTQQIAYIADNDGRLHTMSSGSNQIVPNITGAIFLPAAQGEQHISYNWWIPNGDVSLDYGPSWFAYAQNDSLGMGWTADYGSPVGDLHRYQIMSNGELDYDQVHTADTSWIHSHPQGEHQWFLGNQSQDASDIRNGYDTRYLMSFGPLGYLTGDHTELAPGEGFIIWMAYIGGLEFHDSLHPQPSNVNINPALFDFANLIAKAQSARDGACFNWLGTPEPSASPSVSEFSLAPVYPNPFNSTAVISFTLSRAQRVEIAVFDVLGRKAGTLASSVFEAGTHSLQWNAGDLASGLYFVQARTARQCVLQKAVVLK